MLNIENHIRHQLLEIFDKIKYQKEIDIVLLSHMYCLACVRKVQIEKDINIEICSFDELKHFLLQNKHSVSQEVYCAIENIFQSTISSDIYDLILNLILHKNFLFDLNSVKKFSKYISDEYLERITNSEHTTPEWLNRLAVAMLNPVNGTFFDGVNGIGNTVLAAYKHSIKNHGKLSMHTQEINSAISNVFILRTFLENIENIKHLCCNTLEEQSFLNNCSFDYSIMFPPLGMSNNTGNLFSLQLQQRFPEIDITKISQEWYFALIQIAVLNDSGSAIICMSNGALFNQMSKDVRNLVLNMNIIDAIISFPANSLNNTASPTNLVLFNKSKKEDSKILMLNAEDLMNTNTISSNRKRFILSEESKNDLINTYLKNTSAKNICKLIHKSEILDSNLLPSKYIKKIIVDTQEFGDVTISANIENIENDGQWLPLSELADITIGMNNAKFTEVDENGEIKIIKLSDIQNGEIQFETIESYRLINREVEKLRKYRVCKSDILLSCKGPAIKICEVPQIKDNHYISANFFSLRAKKDKIHPLYLKYYLESPIGQYFIKNRQTGSTIIMINSADIKTLPIFYIPLAEQEKLIEKLYSKELEIKKQIKKLSKELIDAKWNFYDDIGIEKYMNFNKEDNE